MAQTNTVARTVRDLGLANWFGGSLMGAVALNGSAGAVSDARERGRVPRAGWQRWTPLEAAGILAVVAGDTVLIASRPHAGGHGDDERHDREPVQIDLAGNPLTSTPTGRSERRRSRVGGALVVPGIGWDHPGPQPARRGSRPRCHRRPAGCAIVGCAARPGRPPGSPVAQTEHGTPVTRSSLREATYPPDALVFGRPHRRSVVLADSFLRRAPGADRDVDNSGDTGRCEGWLQDQAWNRPMPSVTTPTANRSAAR